MSSPRGDKSKRAAYLRGGKPVVKKIEDSETDTSDDEDERDISYSSNKGAKSDLLDGSYLGEDNVSKISNRLRSNHSSKSSPTSSPSSLSSSPPRKSPEVKKIYPDLSPFQTPQALHKISLECADLQDTSTSKSLPINLNLNNSASSSSKESSISNSFVFYSIIGGIVAIIMLWYLVKPGSPESPPTLVPFSKYVIDIDSLSQQLPNQKKRLWTTIKASARHILNETQSDYPSVILMASDIHASDTALCLARLITSRFESAGRKSHDLSVADIAKLKHLAHVEQKKALDESMNNLLHRHKYVIVNNLQLLYPEAALLLHAYCDNDNAPFKDAMIVLIYYTDDDVRLDPDRPNNFEAYLEGVWSKELHIDKVSAIMSRVANNIVVVTKESKASIESVCSNI